MQVGSKIQCVWIYMWLFQVRLLLPAFDSTSDFVITDGKTSAKHTNNIPLSKCDHFKTIFSCRFGRSYLHHVKLHHRIKRLFYPFHWPLTSYIVSTRYSSWVYTSWDGKAPSSNQVAVVGDALGWDPLFASEFTSPRFHTKKKRYTHLNFTAERWKSSRWTI